jgi:hypothetical protein
VSVKKAELIKLTKGSPIGFLLTLTHAHDAEWLAIRHKDGRVESMDEVLKQVTTSEDDLRSGQAVSLRSGSR